MSNQQIFSDYGGWGGSYQYFPVLYVITAFGHWLTGADVFELMSKIAPIFGGLTILIFYFIVYEWLRNKNVAILSALFLSIAPSNVVD